MGALNRPDKFEAMGQLQQLATGSSKFRPVVSKLTRHGPSQCELVVAGKAGRKRGNVASTPGHSATHGDCMVCG